MAHVLVSADGERSYEAMADKSRHWNGFLIPRFTLETVRIIAADLQADIATMGHSDMEEIRVIEAPAVTEDAAVVVHITWAYFIDARDRCAKIISPGADGLFPIGAREWTWTEVERQFTSETG